MRRINVLLALLFLTFSEGPLFAQQPAGDTSYVRNFKNIFHFKVITQFRPVLLQVQDEENGESVFYRPNSRPLVGLGGEVVGIGFAFVLRVPESWRRDPDVFGNTRFHDFQFNWYQKSFAADFQYQYYQGFYVSSVNIPGISYEQIRHKPDLRLEGFGLNGVYVLNPEKFSYAAAFNNSSKQLRSRGSFLMLGSLKHSRMATEASLIPNEFLNEFPSFPRFREGAFTGFSIMPGYAQTFVVGNFYLNLALAVGPDLQYKKYTVADGPVYEWAVEGKMNFRGGFGYDNGKFFTGIYYQARRNKYSVESINVVHDAGFLRLLIGHRFQETSWMQGIRNMKLYKRIMNPFDQDQRFLGY